MKDRAAFQASTAFRSSMRKGVGRSSSVMMDADAERALGDMGLSKKTVAQNDMDDLFKGKEKKAPAPREPRKGPNAGSAEADPRPEVVSGLPCPSPPYSR